jgi:hypothetical protein
MGVPRAEPGVAVDGAEPRAFAGILAATQRARLVVSAWFYRAQAAPRIPNRYRAENLQSADIREQPTVCGGIARLYATTKGGNVCLGILFVI